MKFDQDVILAPVITEKSMAAAHSKKYTFKVASDANKVEIRKAAEKLFGVTVKKVNTIHMRGQNRRMGRYEGKTSAWKKAIVTLTEDSKSIEFFEGLL